MSEGIGEVRKVMGNALAMVNAEQQLAQVDWKLVGRQVMDLDEAEAHQIAQDFGTLDLNDDAFEAKMEAIVNQGADYAAMILRMVRVFFPKK